MKGSFGEWEYHSKEAKIIGAIILLIAMPALLIYLNWFDFLGLYLFAIGFICIIPYMFAFLESGFSARIKTIGTIGIVLLISAVAFQMNLVTFKTTLQNVAFAINPQCPVARPYFGSINCEKYQQVPYNVFGGLQFSVGPNYGVHDARAVGMQRASSTGNCAWGDIIRLDLIDYNINFGTSTRTEICRTQQENFNQNICNQGALRQNILNGHTYTVDVYCRGIIGNQYAHPSPTDFIITYQYTNEIYKIYFDSAHSIPLTNTIGCKSQDLYDAYYTQYNKDMKKDQANPLNLDKITNSINSGLMALIPFQAGTGSASVPAGSFITDVPMDAKAGDAFVIITDWKLALPGLSTYAYKGQEVYCDQFGGFRNHRLIAFDTIRTGFAGQDYCYTIPTRTILTGVECCYSGECQAFYNDASYSCDTTTFTCKKSIACYSDLQCGTQQYCSYQNGKFMMQGSACINGQCTTTNQEVKCCPSGTSGANCPAGTYCKIDEGCKVEIQKCPDGACCTTGEEYIFQTCGSDKPVCCPTSNKNLGWCKKTQAECNCITANCGICQWYDLGCLLSGFFSNLGFTLPSVSFDVAIMGALTGAVLLGLVGFLVGGPIGAAIGAFLGLLLGWSIAGILAVLRPFIALLAIFLGGNYAYDFLETKISDKNTRLAVAAFLGIIAGVAVFLSYWFGAAILLIYFILKMVWAFIPYGRPTKLVGKSKWLYGKIKK